MRFEERELDLYEQAVNEIESAIAKGKRVEKIYMSQEEFDEFYQLAMNRLQSSEITSFMNRKEFQGAQIVIEDQPKRTRKEKLNADHK